MSRFTSLVSNVGVLQWRILLLPLLLFPAWAGGAKTDLLCYQDSTGWEIVLEGRIREDKALEFSSIARGSDMGKLFKLVAAEPGDYLQFLIFPNGHSLVWKPQTSVVLELEDGSRIKQEAVYFIESPLQQTLYDAGKGAIPIEDGLASREGGFAVFVKFPWRSVRCKPEGFKVYRMGVRNLKPNAAMSAEGE